MAQRGSENPPILGSAAASTNPILAAVMADTGAVAHAGNYEVRIIISASAAAAFNVARRNAGNTADVSPFPMLLYAAGAQSSQYALMVRLDVSERLVVRMAAALTGQAQALIQIEAMI